MSNKFLGRAETRIATVSSNGIEVCSGNRAKRLVLRTHGYATIENAAFKDAGSGRLMVVLDGQVHITKAREPMLSQQVKERIAGQ
ncbi:MAG TPA: hypothetical protein VN776_03895 [Terracidiphilus sp.]|nr:hypothetical protein [Terracidiphilus sp.]